MKRFYVKLRIDCPRVSATARSPRKPSPKLKISESGDRGGGGGVFATRDHELCRVTTDLDSLHSYCR